MSGIEIVVLVGAGIYISKKVKERRERKRLDHESVHGIPQVVEPTTPRLRKKPVEEEEALPLYQPPEKDSELLQPPNGPEVLGESSTARIQRNQVAVEGEEDDALPPPSYEDLQSPPATNLGLFPSQQSAQSSAPTTPSPEAEKKSKRLSRPKFSFHRSTKSQPAVEA